MASEAQAVQTSARDGACSRLVGAIVSPRATFESIARKPGWLLPVLLLIVVNAAVGYSTFRTGYLRVSAEKQMEANPAFAGLTPEQRKQDVALGMRFAHVSAIAMPIIVTPIALLIIAVVFLGAFRVSFGAGIKFAQSFAVTAYAAVPSILKGLLNLAVIWARPPSSANVMRNLSFSSLAGYLPAHASPTLTILAGHIDLFTFWMLGLLAVGYAAASAKKARFGSALAVVLVVWAVFVLAHLGLAAIGSSFVPSA